MSGIGLFDLSIPGLGKTKHALATLLTIHCVKWNHVEIMGMKSQNSQDAVGFGQIANENLFQIGCLTTLPFLKIIAVQVPHLDHHFDRRNDGRCFNNA